MTKAQMYTYIKHQLIVKDRWAILALIKLYSLQTYDEQNQARSIFRNDWGFNSWDCTALTRYAQKYLKYGYLTRKELKDVKLKIVKYYYQLYLLSNKDKLYNQCVIYYSKIGNQLKLFN